MALNGNQGRETRMTTADVDRRTEIVGGLQEAIDSLIGSLESGVGFDHAMYRYS
jgi:hypothetical protein